MPICTKCGKGLGNGEDEEKHAGECDVIASDLQPDSYRLAHDALFRTVAALLVRDYQAPNETAETVAEWCENEASEFRSPEKEELLYVYANMEPSELTALIADVEGYERRQG